MCNPVILAEFMYFVAEKKIQVFNYGNCKSDFTYADNIVEGVKRAMQGAPEKNNREVLKKCLSENKDSNDTDHIFLEPV